MKILRKLSTRKLDKLQDRLAEKYWHELDVAPFTPRKNLVGRIAKILLRIADVRLRRLGL